MMFVQCVTSCAENTFTLHSAHCRVGPNQKFRIRHDRILSIRRISDFGKSIGFHRIRIRNPSHPCHTGDIFKVMGSKVKVTDNIFQKCTFLAEAAYC